MDQKSFNLSDLNLFDRFFKKKKLDFENYYYIPYLLLSPVYLNHEYRKYEAYMPLVLLIKHKTDKTDCRFETIHINFTSLDFYPLFTYVQEKNFDLFGLNNIDEFKPYFNQQVVKFNALEAEEITLKEVIASTLFYRKINSFLEETNKGEKFYKFHTRDGKTYIISAIENVRFFYTYGKYKSLRKVLLNPGGLHLLVNFMNQSPKDGHYNLMLHNDCKKDDATYALYFYHKDYLLEMFNSIRGNYDNTGYLSAPFPTYGSLEIFCNCYTLRENEYLITKIIDTTLFNDLKKRHKEVTHPNDKERDKDKVGGRKPPAQKPPKDDEDENSDDSLDDTQPADPYVPIVHVTEDIDSPFEQVQDDIEYKKNGSKGPGQESGEEEEPEGGKTPTTQDHEGGNNGGQKVDKQDIFYPKDLQEAVTDLTKNGLSKVIEFFQKLGYKYEVTSYEFPDKRKANGEVKKVQISYHDKDKTIKRKYTLFRFFKSSGIFFYLEAEPFDEFKKEVLIIKKDISFKEMQTKYVTKIIYDQVSKGSHKWLLKYQHGLLGSEYKLFKHTKNTLENIKKFIENRRNNGQKGKEFY